MGPEIVLGGIELGVKAIQIWSEYNAELLALQAQRKAEGREVTQAEVDAQVAKTHAKLDANRAKIEAAKAAYDAS